MLARLTLTATVFSFLLVGCSEATKPLDVVAEAVTPQQEAKSEEPIVRVILAKSMEQVTITPAGPYRLEGEGTNRVVPGNEPLVLKAQSNGIAVQGEATISHQLNQFKLTALNGTDAILIEKVPVGVGWWWETTEDRFYEGELSVYTNDEGKIDLVLALPVEEYLRGVVPSEIGGNSPTEALKAQAVAARSETMTALTERQYAGPYYDICADVNCQVFSGTNKRTDATDAAIKATRGVIVSYDGKPIPTYYSSNCGGHTEDVGNVWPVRDRGIPCWSGRLDGDGAGPSGLDTDAGVRAWLASNPNVFCNHEFYPELPGWTHKNFRWDVTTDADKLGEMIARRQDLGRITAIESVERGEGGRLIKVRFVGEKGSVEVGPELAIRQSWVPPLKSAAFVVDTVGDDPSRPDAFTITGGGYGHGVGMCQTGAMGRALAGQDYVTILKAYYTEATIEAVY